jgi:mannose-6-phosphate isomerase-like protein (cupin superfamily)
MMRVSVTYNHRKDIIRNMDKQYVFPLKKALHYRFPTHVNNLVMDRKDAETSEVFLVVIEPSQAAPVHVHHDTEQVYYMMEGVGELRIGEEDAEYFTIQPGDVVRIPPHTPHSVKCQGETTVKYLCVDCFVGGRPEAEPTWDSHVAVLCQGKGWDLVHGTPLEE